MKFLNDNFEDIFIVPLMLIMSILIFVQVIMRKLGHSLVWSEELARYLFIWLIYFAVSYTARREKHIRIDAAINLYPKSLRPIIEIISEIIILAFAVFIAYTAVVVVGKINFSGQRSAAMRIPMTWVYAAPLVGFVLTSIRQVQTIFKKIKNLGKIEEVNE